MKKILLWCAAVCLAAGLTACGSESSYTTTEGDTGTATATASPENTSETTTAGAETTGPTITMANMSFGEPITVAPGAQITVKNDDSAEHSVTSQTEGQFDVHVDGGEQGSFTAPTEPGEYAFYCVYHPSMKGTLIVK
ncbi:cupredoxin domain-containing protein [Mycobacterium barrassiae]|uniref:cupredoxin domain-containing protein n=1 Tax=Mycobacterium barrassiae TaxID=319709 RepID=UPI002265DC2F|nr:cupredoxin domain-containing protein [Mycobacterium barrassiae]MCV7298697.1 cupredoxin domain-containing protein [Mycobacterium barrassiae]